MAEVKQSIDKVVNDKISEYKNIALEIHEKPEVSNYEFYACERLSNKLLEEGFEVRVDVAGHRTGFDARYQSTKPGPVVVFLAEYDALPEIGHACGHNLFGTTSALAAVAYKSIIDEIGGEVRVYGTPGEEGGENGSAKASFVDKGYFEDVDIALCAHPGFGHYPTSKSLANDPVDVEFFGVSSHAAGAPEKGINALDAIIQTYNSVNALREHLSDDVRIHGVITNGGSAANVVPDYASARFYLRANTRKTLNDVYEKFDRIVQGAALATGATYKFGLFQNSVDNTIPTPRFDEVYEECLHEYGEAFSSAVIKGGGSTDVGNVSQVIPVIHPIISISDTYIAGHSIEFKAASCSEKGLESIDLGAKVLALTAYRVVSDEAVLRAIKEDHARQLNVAEGGSL